MLPGTWLSTLSINRAASASLQLGSVLPSWVSGLQPPSSNLTMLSHWAQETQSGLPIPRSLTSTLCPWEKDKAILGSSCHLHLHGPDCGPELPMENPGCLGPLQ